MHTLHERLCKLFPPAIYIAPLPSYAELCQVNCLETITWHGQAASDWVNREAGQWIKDVYVELESLGKLSSKDVVENTSNILKFDWNLDFKGEKKYEDLDEEEKEQLEEASRDFFGISISRDDLLMNCSTPIS